ncbi:regulator of cell cycle RGCC-like isoform X2 [Pseudophryne corroboree]|uniref:regulator of cell cycle RGCC-like isoform X2 n=1 Tax=Pseudophryne corroboree TaxID=495146 RepID=UPI0030812E97
MSLGEDLVLTLSEFDDALQDFTRGPCNFEEHLKKLKQQHQATLNHSSSDSESVISSQRSSLNTSEENFSFSFTNTRHHPKAKLGDTKELENFITDLDKVLSDF